MENNIPPGMIAFDLETALKHPERARTRDGKTISEIYHFKTSTSDYPLAVAIDGCLYAFKIDGFSHSSRVIRNLDLFLTEPEMWVNVYVNSEGKPFDGVIYSSKQEATIGASETQKYIGTYKLVKE